MLLRRITKHVKDQNWFAVGLDFLIVVIGVFIGLQVNTWNEARQDRVVAAQFELGLTADAKIILEDVRSKIAFMEEALVAVTWLQDAFSQNSAVPDEAEVVDRLRFTLTLPSHPNRAPSLIEAVANRDLRLIGNEDLRLEILSWDRLLQDSAITQQARREYTRAYVAPLSRLGALAPLIPFEEAVSDSGSRNDMLVALSAMQGVLGGELDAFRLVEQETKTLVELLEARH
ncbi:MAG: hypothetical protein AAGF53_06450 [Pseudomonadota bacterium]